MKGYKGFNASLVCRGKKYTENTVFEEDGKIEMCSQGMHFCQEPLEILNYYPLINGAGNLNEFATVESLGETKSDLAGEKFCTNKLQINEKISFSQLVQCGVDCSYEDFLNTKVDANTEYKNLQSQEKINTTDSANILNLDCNTYINNSGHYCDIINNIYDVCIKNSGNQTFIVNTKSLTNINIKNKGNNCHINNNGHHSYIYNIGDNNDIFIDGHSNIIGNCGTYCHIGINYNYNHIANSGYGAAITINAQDNMIDNIGDATTIADAGNSSIIYNSSNHTYISSSGESAEIVSKGNGNHISISGRFANITAMGENNVVTCSGTGCMVRASVGTWITLTEYKLHTGKNTTKTEYVDNKKIMADTWYMLLDNEFIPVE